MANSEIPELTIPDEKYEKQREKLDEKNRKELEKLSLEDQIDASTSTPGRNVTKKPEVTVKLSDFTDLRYTMRQVHMGYFIIFNQDKYVSGHPYHNNPRAGSSVDAEKLEKSMKSLGFTVVRYDNRKTSEIKKYMKQYTTAEQNKTVNAFGCAFFSHGEQDGELATFDDFINVKDLVEQVHVKNAPNLVGKPKLFFFQACRGGQYMDGQKLQAVAFKANPVRISWPDAADILCHFATTEGHLSFRNPNHGSWFIRNLTDKIDKYGLKQEFHHVLLRVNAGIADIESQTGQVETSGKKQAAQIQSQMTKELHFGDYKK